MKHEEELKTPRFYQQSKTRLNLSCWRVWWICLSFWPQPRPWTSWSCHHSLQLLLAPNQIACNNQNNFISKHKKNHMHLKQNGSVQKGHRDMAANTQNPNLTGKKSNEEWFHFLVYAFPVDITVCAHKVSTVINLWKHISWLPYIITKVFYYHQAVCWLLNVPAKY